jgi:tetratricopeptide (TPR) repeat protein
VKTKYWKSYYSPEEVEAWNHLLQCGLTRVLDFSGKQIESEKILRKVLETCEEPVNENQALMRLFTNLRFQHRYDDLIGVVEKLLENYREIAQDNPDLQFGITEITSMKATSLIWTGQYRLAMETYDKIIERYRAKSVTDDNYLADFAQILWEFASLLGLSDRLQEAEIMVLESIGILRELVHIYPERHIQKLATAINNHGIIYFQMDKISEAQDAILESYKLAKDNSTQYSEAVYLAEVYGIITNNLGASFQRSRKYVESGNYLREANELLDRYAKRSPEMFLPHIATVMNNIAVLLCETNSISEAESKFNESLKIRRDCVTNSEAFFFPKVASVLNNLGIFYRRMKQQKKSENMYREALEIMEPFAENEPEIHQRAFIQILNNALILYSDTNESAAIGSTGVRLKEAGVEEPLSYERWFVDMEYL